MQPLVSIIVPVYNDEKYIDRCIISLLNQDYPNFEIIIVDDGSIDKSPEIIDKYLNNPLVKITHQKNSGVSFARNVGLKMSSGKYIMFVDGDDWVDKNYVTYFTNLIIHNNCKVGMCTRNYTDDNLCLNDNMYNSYIVSSEKAIEWIYDDTIFVAVWNKIYDSSLFFDCNIFFTEGIWYGEGMLINIDILQRVDNVAIGDCCVYHQTSNPDSAMRSFNLNSVFCGISSMWLQKSHWKKINPRIEFEWQYHLFKYNRAIIDGIIRIDKCSEYNYALKSAIHYLRKDIFVALKKNINVKQKIKWICSAIFPRTMAKRTLKLNNSVKS